MRGNLLTVSDTTSSLSPDDVEATFAFVDLAGFTALTEAHGDAEAIAIVRAFRDRVLAALEPGDELVKTIGDAIMLKFPTATAAIVALRTLLQQELTIAETTLLPRAGAHHGHAVSDDGDYYGAAVNLAARVAGQARGGQLLVTTHVALAARDLGATITHIGAIPLRNITESIDLYDVRIGDSVEQIAVDPVCQMRVPSTGDAAITLEWSGGRFHFCGLHCVSRFAADPTTFIERMT
jgi:class 3 adenylate cyclase/YHS domain-containing protein